MRTFIQLAGVTACCVLAAEALAGDATAEGIRDALLWYEDCESLRGRNKDLGIRINSATLVDGKIGKALLLERREANQLANPDFDSLDGWIAVGKPELCREGGRFSPVCVRITESDYVRQVVTELKPSEQAWCCLSTYAKSDSPETRLELRVDREMVKEFPLAASYTRLVLSFQAERENSTITLRARGPGVVTVDAVQLEQRHSFPSSFCPAARRPTQSIEIPVSDRTLNVAEGSIAFWIQPLWIRESGTGQSLFAWWGDANNPGAENLTLSAYPGGLVTDHDYFNRILFMRTRAKRHDSFSVKSFPLSEWAPGSWHHVVAAWKANAGESPSQLMLYLDGKLLPPREAPWGENKTPKLFSIGYHWGAYADAAVDEIAVFRRALTAAEVDWLFKLCSSLR